MKKIKYLCLLLTACLVFSLFGCIPGGTEPISETVGSGHFSTYSLSEVSYEGGKAARVSILTDVSLISYYANISLLDKSGKTLIEHDSGADEIIAAGATFSVYIPLGEVSFSEIDSAKLNCSGKTYDISGDYLLDNPPRVTFMCDGTRWAKQTASVGEPIPCPDTPHIDGKIFEGWYSDSEFKTPFDFAKGTDKDIIVYAKLADDIGNTVNRITKELMTSIVTVRATYSEDKIWNPSKMESTSSGVIIRKGQTSYILTNCHSTTLLEGYEKIELEVEDCFGNVYPATVAETESGVCSDAAYDLAILAVNGLSAKLSQIELDAANPKVGERVFSLGSPAGQQNAITVGEITDFCNVKLEAEEYLTNVEFGVIAHTAEVRQGSSGGALVNSELQLVGINFAGKGGDDFSNGYAIPIEKIHEFIDRYM